MVERRLVEKYGERAFMYTEYPNMRFWSKAFKDPEYRVALLETLRANPSMPLMLYVHIPFCFVQCLYCTCHVVITRRYEPIIEYLGFLHREIEMLHEFFSRNNITPNFREVHLGGGTPTYLRRPEFDALIEKLRSLAAIGNLDEFSIEIDPRHSKQGDMVYYAHKGITRVSFGVQDFELEVQEAVDRVQPARLMEPLLDSEIRRLFSRGVNFDIICGLPRQTQESMRRTMEMVIAMSPDRICLNYMDFKPEFFPHQLLMPAFPGNFERKSLFLEAEKLLLENGYVRTGYDHFAKPSDDVARALQQGEMQWGRLGVTAGRYTGTIGLGVHAVSMIGLQYYFQNFFASSQKEYESLVVEGKFPIFRGHKMSADDLLRRDIIHILRNYFFLDTVAVASRHAVDFPSYFARELLELREFTEDGLTELSETAIKITEQGRLFADNVCRVFDRYSNQIPK